MSTSTASIPAPTPTVPSAATVVHSAAISKLTLLNRCRLAAEYAGSYDIVKETSTPLVFQDEISKKNRLAMVRVYELESPVGSSGTPSRSIICVGRIHTPSTEPPTADVWRVWCGDSTLDGSLSARDAESRRRDALRGIPLTLQSKLNSALRTSTGSMRPSTSPGSHFWASYQRTPEKMGCKHVRHAMRALMDRAGGLEAVLEEVEAAYQDTVLGTAPAGGAASTGGAATTSPASAASSSSVPVSPTSPSAPTPSAGSPLVAPGAFSATSAPTVERALAILETRMRANGPMFREILDVAGPSVEWKQPVLILGESGYGKTHTGRAIGKSGLYDHFFEFAVNPETDGLDFIGGPRRMSQPKADGSGDETIDRHMDSDVVSAFRLGASGKNVFLLLDEIGNARREVLNALKNILNPDHDHYIVKTGRASAVVNGIATPEELRVPIKRMTIVATTNIGVGYEANLADRAVLNRFWKIFHEIDHDQVGQIVVKEATGKGFSRDCSLQLERFYRNMRKLHADKLCERLPNPRDFCRAVRLASDEQHLPKILARMAQDWCGDDLEGTPNKDQAETIREAVKDAFTIKDKNWNWKP